MTWYLEGFTCHLVLVSGEDASAAQTSARDFYEKKGDSVDQDPKDVITNKQALEKEQGVEVMTLPETVMKNGKNFECHLQQGLLRYNQNVGCILLPRSRLFFYSFTYFCNYIPCIYVLYLSTLSQCLASYDLFIFISLIETIDEFMESSAKLPEHVLYISTVLTVD